MKSTTLLLRTAWLLAALIGLSPVFAQNHTLTGKVTDAFTNDPLPGVSVAIPSLGVGGFSDNEGKFTLSFQATTSSNLEVTASLSGYVKLTQTFTLSSGTQVLDFSLEPEAGYQADDVVITASKGFEQKQSDLTISIQVIKQKSIELQAVANMSRVINQIPGVDNQDGQINIRGSSGYAYGVGSRVMVTLDGLPLLTGDGGSVTLDLIPVDNIAQVEVLKGASSVLYGSGAMGGVINVISAEPGDKPRTSVRVRGGMFGPPSNRALDWDGNKNAYQASAHVFHSRKIGPLSLVAQTDFIRDSGYRLGGNSQQFRGLLFAKYRPKSIPGMAIGLNLSTQVDSSGQMLYWKGYYPDTLTSSTGQDSIVGGALTPTGDAGGFRRQLRTYVALDPSIKWLTPGGHIFWYRGRFLKNQSTNSTNQSSSNFILYNDLLYQTTLLKHISWISGATYTYSLANGDSLYGGQHPGRSVGVYTQFDAKYTRWNFNLGLRYESVKIDTLPNQAKPIFRLGVNYKIAEGTNIRVSAGQAFRVPTVAERFTNTAGGAIVVQPNPNIRSEYGYSAEIGLRQGYRFGNKKNHIEGYLDAAGFMMRYSDMVEFGISKVNFTSFPPEVLFSSINIADARITGLEVTTLNQATLGKWTIALSGGITWTDPVNLNSVPESNQLNLEQYQFPRQFLGALIDVMNPNLSDQPRLLKYRPKALVRTSTTIGYGPVSLTANYRYRSFIQNIDQYLFVVVGDLADFRARHSQGDHVVDLILSVDPTPNLTLSLNVDNATNTEYMLVPGFLAEQRKVGLQARWRF